MLTNKPALTLYKPVTENGLQLPYIDVGVSAGFPSPALDFMEYQIDLGKHVTKNPHTTYYIKVAGNSMTNAGIDNGDLLVIDRSLSPADGKIAICMIDGEFTVKRLKIEAQCLYLVPENPAYPAIKVTEENEFVIWAIVTYVIKKI